MPAFVAGLAVFGAGWVDALQPVRRSLGLQLQPVLRSLSPKPSDGRSVGTPALQPGFELHCDATIRTSCRRTGHGVAAGCPRSAAGHRFAASLPTAGRILRRSLEQTSSFGLIHPQHPSSCEPRSDPAFLGLLLLTHFQAKLFRKRT